MFESQQLSAEGFILLEEGSEISYNLLRFLVQSLPLIQVEFLHLQILLFEPIDLFIFICELCCPFIQNIFAFVLELSHILFKLINYLALSYIFYLSSRSRFLLIFQLIMCLQHFSLDFPSFFLKLMMIDLILDKLFFMLFDLNIGLFESCIQLIAFLGQFGIFLSFCVQLSRQLDYSLLLKCFLFHLSNQISINNNNCNHDLNCRDQAIAILSILIYMSAIAKISKLLPSSLQFQKNAVPTILIDGLITPQTTFHVHTMLQRIPQNKDKIAILVNSRGGCYAQTHIILKKISLIAKRNKAQVWTFGQEWALNAGFLLLSSGNRVFIDNSTAVGGVEVGQSKLLKGKLGEYIDSVTYFNQRSYVSELNTNQSFDEAKRQQVISINNRLSEQIKEEINKYRWGKISQQTNLNKFYIGQEAVRLGLADSIDRIHLALARQSLQNQSVLLDKNDIQKWFQKIRKLNISD